MSKRYLQSYVAMTIVFISLGMLFATLFMMYLLFRSREAVWPPMGMEVSLLFPTLSTAFILLSGLSFQAFVKFYNQQNLLVLKRWLMAALILGACFLFSQLSLWHQLKMTGIYVQSGIFASIIYSFTWIHAAHMVFGLLALMWLCFTFYFDKSWMAEESNFWQKTKFKVKNVGLFWHFLDVIWLLMYLTIFIF